MSISQLWRWSQPGRSSRLLDLIHQLCLEGWWSFRRCVLSISTMGKTPNPVGLRETSYFYSPEVPLRASPKQRAKNRLATSSPYSCCCLGTLLRRLRNSCLVLHSHLDRVFGTGVRDNPDSCTAQAEPATSGSKRKLLGFRTACASHTIDTTFICCLGAPYLCSQEAHPGGI